MNRKVDNKTNSNTRAILRIREYFFSPRFHFSRIQFNLIAIILVAIGSILGIYLTVTKVFPLVFALNDTNKQWTFNTANQAQFTYDSNIMAVDNTGAHLANPVNKVLNPNFTSDNSNWTVSAIVPSGYTVVPGNATFGTSDFLAMKYEAKCASTSSLAVGLTSPADATYEVYRDDGAVTSANNCTSGNSRQVVSTASGYPIAYISQTEAATRCSTVSLGGTSAHLITNDEWMSIARNAEAQPINWSLGSVGSGYLYAGHNDNSPAKARIASSNDANRSAYTDAGGTTEALTTATNTANGQSGTTGNQVRTFNLSNGQVIWDIAGNIWEWNNNTILGKDQPTSGTGGFTWREFTALTTYGTLTYDKVRPLSNSYTSSYGVGQIYSDGTVSNNTSYGFVRGGYWDASSTAGAFAMLLNSAPAGRPFNIGFRCTSDPVAILQSYSSTSGVAGSGGNSFSIGSVTDGKIIQNINVGNDYTYDFSMYVYDNTSGNVGGTLSATVADLYYNGSAISTTYTDASSSKGAGWWKLSGT